MLKAATLKLRRIESTEDLNFIKDSRNMESIYKHFYEYHPVSLESQRRWINDHDDLPNEKFFGIEYIGETNKLIGTVGVYHIDWRNRKAEWGRFFINKDGLIIPHAGKIVESIILDYVFNYLNLNRLYCEVLESNTKVIELHKSFGFIEEGVFREFIYKDGEYVDVVALGMLRSDFNNEITQEMIKGYLKR